ncbi:solute carrier family 26 member 6-like [Agrilus planipennis]|uniref:Solute carrier family 26 member 6-like n=1 Tax=Agrilus planipennis TaxID=224129 RepID=A0A1W4XG85_AGRPL|nr:solute carrier family 26 member 6-like [Agrilus planipennis]
MEDASPLVVKIERPLYEQEQLHAEYGYEKPPKSSITENIQNCKSCNPIKVLLNIVPAIRWLSKYHLKTDLTGDLVAGFTVAIMNIPQGMAYALLGNVPPICGLYMGFFPVLIYFLMGTSRHNSTGSFAVVCLMAGKVVLKNSDPFYFTESPSGNLTEAVIPTGYSPVQVAASVSFLVGFIQIIMYAFRLGILSVLLSDTLVSGFTTAAAIQVFTSQLKDILGVEIPKITGYFEIIYTFIYIFQAITSVNFVVLLISVVTIVVLMCNNEILKPKISKYCSFPVPVELIAVVVGTLLSKYLSFSSKYHVQIIGEIPTGIPAPSLPKFSVLSDVFMDSLMIAIVSYALTLSMGLIFAQKLNYEIDANQELLALGTGNIFGSFFSCLPYSASISRSVIQETIGGKTQLASLVSCMIMFFVLMWLGPAFEYLPKAVLAALTIVAVKGMLMNVKDFFKFLKLSKADAAVWLCTFLSVIIIGVDVGLLTGICLSLVCVLIAGLKPFACLLGYLPHTDLYLDITRYKGVAEVPGIKIFHYRGGINFASKNTFRSELFRIVGVDPQKELIIRKKLEKHQNLDLSELKTMKNCEKIEKMQNKITKGIHCLVLDFSALSYIDAAGISTIKQIIQQFSKIDIPVLLAACSGPVYEKMKKCELIEHKNSIKMFPTVHDAVQYATKILNVGNDSKGVSTISI